MSRWYPSVRDNLYVIPDVHGAAVLLERVCNRILPLRKSDGGTDRLVFLGDYIDRHIDSHKVLDFLIGIEKEYGDQVDFLMGNHELMLLEAFNLRPGKEVTLQSQRGNFNMWLNNGGLHTLAGYMERAGIEEPLLSYPKNRILDLIPREHIEFMQRLKKCCQIDNYVFVHGGMDPLIDASKQDLEVLVWDRDLMKRVLRQVENKTEQEWDKVIVTGHNVLSHCNPIVTEKYLMLDCGSPRQLLVAELRSMEAYMVYQGNGRMVRYELKETVAPKPMFRRVDVQVDVKSSEE